MKTTSTYGAELIDVMGSDLTVVNAARVSFDKQSDWETVQVDQWEDNALFGAISWKENVKQLKTADAKLIAYLARHSHFTPFCHPQLSFRVQAPIPITRQMFKHKVGLVENEISRRYVDALPVIYVPETWRKRPTDGAKQGSSDETVETMTFEGVAETWDGPIGGFYIDACDAAYRTYKGMIAAGACPEQSRFVLPQGMITEWVWTGSLAAFARVCKQRLDPHAQRECKPVAEAIAKALREHFPVSYMALSA